jgi:hypothetical protein
MLQLHERGGSEKNPFFIGLSEHAIASPPISHDSYLSNSPKLSPKATQHLPNPFHITKRCADINPTYWLKQKQKSFVNNQISTDTKRGMQT